MVTIKDVAREAKVSIATVSYVINKTHKLSDETVEKVNEAIKKLNYYPSKAARSLVKRTTQVLGVLVSDISNPFFAPIVRGIEDAASEKGYIVMVGNSDEDWAKAKKYIDTLAQHRVDGLIISPTSNFEILENGLNNLGIPIVLINRRTQMNYDIVESDNEYGAILAVSHLLSFGHKKIGLIIGPTAVSTFKDRLAGYIKAISDAGYNVEEKYIRVSDQSHESSYKAMIDLLSMNDKPTAVFIGSGKLGGGALHAINEMKVKIPDDLSLVCFDETEWAPIVNPPLTTIAQKTYDMGREAANLLLDHLFNKERSKGGCTTLQQIKLKPELIERQSAKLLIK